jgi:hypothetical protein
MSLANHPYLLKKPMISPQILADHGVKLEDGCLVYGIRTLQDPEPLQVQKICPQLTKKLYGNLGGKAGFFTFGERDLDEANRIILAESLTKAAAIHQAILPEGDFFSVLNCLNAGNMVKVARQLNGLYHDKLVVCADNDEHKSQDDAPHGILKPIFDVVTELNLPVCKPTNGFKDWDDWLGANDFAAEEIWDAISVATPISEPESFKNPLLEAPSFAELLKQPVAPKEFLFKGHTIPRGEFSALVAANGTGKTQMIVQMAIQAATGTCFMKSPKGREVFNPVKPLKTLIVTYEDDASIYAKRMQDTINYYPGTGLNIHQAIEAIGNNLDFLDMESLMGTEFLLTAYQDKDRVIVPMKAYYCLKDKIANGGYDLVIIDPWHYATAAEENDNNAQGQHVALIRSIARECNCSIFGFAHTTDSNPVRLRGATAVVDRARSSMFMATLPRLIATTNTNKGLAIPQVDALPAGINMADVVMFKRTKNSYGPNPDEYDLLKRTESGMLIPFDLSNQEHVPGDGDKILAFINEAGEKGTTQALIVDALDIAQHKVSRKLKALVDGGKIQEEKRGTSKWLFIT